MPQALLLMGVALLMLYLSDGRDSLWGAGFLLGLGMGLSLLQFLRMMIYLPLHCERGQAITPTRACCGSRA